MRGNCSTFGANRVDDLREHDRQFRPSESGSSRANSSRINHSSKCLPRHELGTSRVSVSHRNLWSLGGGSNRYRAVDLELEVVLDYARRLRRAYHPYSDVP